MSYRFCCCLAILLAASPAVAEVIELSNGDRLHGVTNIEHADDVISFDHPALGRITLPAERVAAVLPDPVSEAPVAQDAAAAVAAPAASAEPVPAAPPAEPEALDLQLFGVPVLAGWQRRLEVSASAARGNSETDNLQIGFDGRFEDPTKRWRIDADYYRATSSGELSRNQLRLDVTRDWLVPEEPYFYFVKTRYEYDDFATWRHDATLNGGVGYQLYDDEKLDLLMRLGAGGNYTWGPRSDAVSDTFTPEGMLAVEGVWRVKLIYPFEIRNEFYPDLGELGEFRNITELAFHIPVDAAKGLSLKLGLYNEYESETEDDAKHNDVNYFASLVFDF